MFIIFILWELGLTDLGIVVKSLGCEQDSNLPSAMSSIGGHWPSATLSQLFLLSPTHLDITKLA